MKKIKLTGAFLLLVLFVTTSCAKEEDEPAVKNDCPLSTWLGDYTGTVSVDGGATSAIEFSIKEVNTDGFQIVTTGLTVGDFTPTSCSETKEFSNPFGKDEYTVVKDGDEVTWTKKEYDSNNVLEETTVRIGTK